MTRLYDNKGPGARTLTGVPGTTSGVKWQREGPPGRCAWFTEPTFGEAQGIQAEIKVAILMLEPPWVSLGPYQFIWENPKVFDVVLSYLRYWRPPGVNVLPYYLASSRLKPSDCHLEWEKTRLVSLIAPSKRGLPGHAMRHLLVADRPRVDAYGTDYRFIDPDPPAKIEALGPYMFNVICQSERRDWFFTEALIDAFMTGTVPVYFGCPSIGDIFDARGIIQVDSYPSLVAAVDRLTPALYEEMRPYAAANYRRAWGYVDLDDNLFRSYPELFDEGAPNG